MDPKKDKKELKRTTKERFGTEENTLDEIVKSVSGTFKALFGSGTNYSRYNRKAVGLFAAGYIAVYCDHPVTAIISIPIFAVAGYNFVQAFRYRDEIFK